MMSLVLRFEGGSRCCFRCENWALRACVCVLGCVCVCMCVWVGVRGWVIKYITG